MASDLLLKDKALLRPEEVAEVLSCSRSKIYELIRDGRLRPVKLGSSVRSGCRVSWTEIERFSKKTNN